MRRCCPAAAAAAAAAAPGGQRASWLRPGFGALPRCVRALRPRHALTPSSLPRPPAAAPADDANATALNLDALLAFYDRFPQYRARPLYLTGHSYGGAAPPGALVGRSCGPRACQRPAAALQSALQHEELICALPRPCAGHFIPLLAEAVLEYNDNLPSGAQPIPLEGYAVGNAWTDPALDNAGAPLCLAQAAGRPAGLQRAPPQQARGPAARSPAICPRALLPASRCFAAAGAVEFWYSLGAVSEETYKGLKANCDMETVGELAGDHRCWQELGASWRGAAASCRRRRASDDDHRFTALFSPSSRSAVAHRRRERRGGQVRGVQVRRWAPRTRPPPPRPLDSCCVPGIVSTAAWHTTLPLCCREAALNELGAGYDA